MIGVDRGSRLVSPHDRRTSVFFGDGAGRRSSVAAGRSRARFENAFRAARANRCRCPSAGEMSMDGKAVWNFATDVLPATVRELCAAAKVSVDEIKLLVPHQANRNILAESAAILGLPIERVAINIERYGNTLAGSIPIALHEALAAGSVQTGDKIALSASEPGWPGAAYSCNFEIWGR